MTNRYITWDHESYNVYTDINVAEYLESYYLYESAAKASDRDVEKYKAINSVSIH